MFISFEQNSVYREEGSLTSQWVGTGWVGFSGEGMVKRVGVVHLCAGARDSPGVFSFWKE